MSGGVLVVVVILVFGAVHPSLVFQYYMSWGDPHPTYVF